MIQCIKYFFKNINNIVRYKIIIEYKGIGYYGWQKQKEIKPTIQETVEKALGFLFNEPIVLFVAGRTDASVHALHQVAHFDSNKEYSVNTVKNATNFYLKNSNIVCLNVNIVSSDFHARFSVKQKSYVYYLFNRKDRMTIYKDLAWHVSSTLDMERMRKELSFFEGYHDFTSFCSLECDKQNKNRTIDFTSLNVYDNQIFIRFYAKSFLHNQIRIMVGTLVDISLNRLNDSIENILKYKDRRKAGVTAPAHGLYLENIKY
ncbi:MAG: tRNA pseudouridine synthase A [Candidatus Xenolissoclinum pacificiensis L6]|uniref:tRNA pseudouridine synthase A n=1 Tax=Candidatus Xenolissoclinum pacificiensis L6 TaxID=1401685 RepID=W2V2Y8_9RICK|nr:MAG: tRNA pseudouridine synthase A [Candidatus Xenolissoclinum pacificiensis L6]